METPQFTRQGGKTIWTYEMNRSRNTYPLLGQLKISGWFGVAGFLLTYYLAGWNGRASMGLPLLCGLCITALPAAVCFLRARFSGGKTLFRFEMDEESIRTMPEIKPEKTLNFSDVSTVRIWPRYDTIELRTGRNTFPIYVPSDWFSFVKEFILERIPEDTDIRDFE